MLQKWLFSPLLCNQWHLLGDLCTSAWYHFGIDVFQQIILGDGMNGKCYRLCIFQAMLCYYCEANEPFQTSSCRILKIEVELFSDELWYIIKKIDFLLRTKKGHIIT